MNITLSSVLIKTNRGNNSVYDDKTRSDWWLKYELISKQVILWS